MCLHYFTQAFSLFLPVCIFQCLNRYLFHFACSLVTLPFHSSSRRTFMVGWYKLFTRAIFSHSIYWFISLVILFFIWNVIVVDLAEMLGIFMTKQVLAMCVCVSVRVGVFMICMYSRETIMHCKNGFTVSAKHCIHWTLKIFAICHLSTWNVPDEMNSTLFFLFSLFLNAKTFIALANYCISHVHMGIGVTRSFFFHSSTNFFTLDICPCDSNH